MRHLVFAMLLAVSVAACDSDSGGIVDSEDVVTGALSDSDSPYFPDLSVPDVEADGEDTFEPIYPGNPCDRDNDCSTGFCYGKSTNQGFFEQSICQTHCLGIEDFSKYCNTDADCCTGTCCVGCGWREGLCVSD